MNRDEFNPPTKSFFKTILVIIGLGFFNLVIVLGPFLFLAGLLIGLYGISIGFTIGGLGLFIGKIVASFFPSTINIPLNLVSSISFGIGLSALGVLLLLASFYLTKLLYKGIIKYLQWNIDIIKR